MKTRSKVILAVAIAAALAGTSGAALAAGAPQVTPQVARQPAPQITSQTIGPIGGVRVGSLSVREPGYLTVTVGASGCITDVRAWAYPAGAFGKAYSAVDTRKGTSLTVRVLFPKGAATGTWYLVSVDAIQCGTKTDEQWNTEWDGYRTFTVLPPK